MMSSVIIDSNLSIEEALKNNPANPAPAEILEKLCLIEVQYYSFDSKIHQGQIVIHREIEKIAKGIFVDLLTLRFPIEKVVPMCLFVWDDEKSMQANNTSGYNYRVIKGTDRISLHSQGLAIDINPLQNPRVKKGSESQPLHAVYDVDNIGTITADSEVVKLFKQYGFGWGGDWLNEKGYVDYQHFEYQAEYLTY